MGRARYRITFHKSACARLDPIDFAWRLAKFSIEVIGKEPGRPALHVHAMYPQQVERFADELNRMYGALIFDKVEVATPEGFAEYEFGGAR